MLYNCFRIEEGDYMSKIKVLMIDDNKELVEAVKEYFKCSELIEISSVAYDGVEGLEKIENDIYDVIVLDLIMPKKDGIYVLEKISQRTCRLSRSMRTSCGSPCRQSQAGALP